MALKMQPIVMSERPIKCLLIDDDQDDQEIFLLGIQKSGLNIKCETASNGVEGLKKLEKGNDLPAFIFLDLNMPNLSGKACLTEIKKMDHLKEIPVIMYSTSSYINDIRETRRLGATGFITKPSDVNILADLMVKIFSNQYKFPTSAYYQ